MKDEMIIDLFLERSEQAISEISSKYGKLANGICKNILRVSSDAEECVNDALLTTWNLIPPNHPTSLKAFFIGIARNKAMDRYRFNAAQKRNSFYDVALDELEECLGLEDSPQNQCEAKELSEAINAFLGGIKKEDRQMFVCRYYLADSVEEIAKNMELKPSVVYVRLYRTRDKLKQFLKKENLI